MFDTTFLREVRIAELASILPEFPRFGRVLEIGAGDGTQARELARRGYDVVAVDVSDSPHASRRVFSITEYDRSHIPLPDASVDVVFSSNVLEHVEDLPTLLSEIRRVTRAEGSGIHVVPSVSWRLWTLATGPPTSAVAAASLLMAMARGPRQDFTLRARRYAWVAATAVLPMAHGASGNAFTEILRFRVARWIGDFEANGFEVLRWRRTNLFHSGHMLLGSGLSLTRRANLSSLLGGAANLFVVRST